MNIEWNRVIEQAVGVLLGGGIAIVAIWIKELFDRRAASQAWFEQTYIADGIDQILSYLKTVELHLTTLKNLPKLLRGKGQSIQLLSEPIPPMPFCPSHSIR